MTADDWKPIETAPKDGTRVRLWVDYGHLGFLEKHASWKVSTVSEVKKWRGDAGFPIMGEPTHWQPIVPPKQEPT